MSDTSPPTSLPATPSLQSLFGPSPYASPPESALQSPKTSTPSLIFGIPLPPTPYTPTAITPEKYKAGTKILDFIRNTNNKYLFKLLKHCIQRAEKAKPICLLQRMVPNEAKMVKETSQNIKVRLRFGGETFPPTILFKVFIKKHHIVTINEDIQQLRSSITSAVPKASNRHNEWRRVGPESEFGKVLWTVILDPRARIRDGQSWKPTISLKKRKIYTPSNTKQQTPEVSGLAKYTANVALRSKTASIRSARNHKLHMLRALYGLSSAEAELVDEKIMQGPPDNGESLDDLLSWCDDLQEDTVDQSEGIDVLGDGSREDMELTGATAEEEPDESLESLEELLYDLEPPSP